MSQSAIYGPAAPRKKAPPPPPPPRSASSNTLPSPRGAVPSLSNSPSISSRGSRIYSSNLPSLPTPPIQQSSPTNSTTSPPSYDHPSTHVPPTVAPSNRFAMRKTSSTLPQTLTDPPSVPSTQEQYVAEELSRTDTLAADESTAGDHEEITRHPDDIDNGETERSGEAEIESAAEDVIENNTESTSLDATTSATPVGTPPNSVGHEQNSPRLSSAPSSMGPKLNDDPHRAHIVLEILHTEKTYINQISQLIKVFSSGCADGF